MIHWIDRKKGKFFFWNNFFVFSFYMAVSFFPQNSALPFAVMQRKVWVLKCHVRYLAIEKDRNAIRIEEEYRETEITHTTCSRLARAAEWKMPVRGARRYVGQQTEIRGIYRSLMVDGVRRKKVEPCFTRFTCWKMVRTKNISINQPINRAITQSINQSIDRSNIQSINRLCNQSTNQPTVRIINQSIYYSINQPINRPFKYSINQSSLQSAAHKEKYYFVKVTGFHSHVHVM